MNSTAPKSTPKRAEVVPIIRALWSGLGTGHILCLQSPEPIVAQLWPDDNFWHWEVKNKHSKIGDRTSSLRRAQESAETYLMALLREAGKTRRWKRG